MKYFAALVLATSAVTALPASIERRQIVQQPYTASMPIHPSCNATEATALRAALADMNNLTTSARDYVASRGNNDTLYKKWFGNGDYVAVIGAYESLLVTNKANMTLRCDNIDGNCNNPGWAGHWRGANATTETAICPLSYRVREPLTEVCAHNYTIAGSNINTYWATDLMHRLYHVPGFSAGIIEHYADSYADCMALAINNATYAPYNTHTLQYFAIDVYAQNVAKPGVGCTGTVPTASSVSASSSRAATSTTSAGTACHTHADGALHCE